MSTASSLEYFKSFFSFFFLSRFVFLDIFSILSGDSSATTYCSSSTLAGYSSKVSFLGSAFFSSSVGCSVCLGSSGCLICGCTDCWAGITPGDWTWAFELDDLVTILRSGRGRSRSLLSASYSCCEEGGETLRVSFFFSYLGSSISGVISSGTGSSFTSGLGSTFGSGSFSSSAGVCSGYSGYNFTGVLISFVCGITFYCLSFTNFAYRV